MQEQSNVMLVPTNSNQTNTLLTCKGDTQISPNVCTKLVKVNAAATPTL